MRNSKEGAKPLIGREEETRTLEEAFGSGRSEFVAVCGRRRVGKTYLVRKTLRDRFAFFHTGLSGAGMEGQLKAFAVSLERSFGKPFDVPADWLAAFRELEKNLGKGRGRKVLFLDELPWMDTPKSGFLSALEYFWNGWASGRDDVMLVVCGSATSWIVRNLVESRGGFHDRLTHRIWLRPFTLGECAAFARAKGLALVDRQVADVYMAFGGVPFYWDLLRKGESPAQAVDRLCFSEEGELRGEFALLFASLFRRPERHVSIVRALASRQSGMTREDLLKAVKTEKGGLFSKALADLEHCGFVRRYRFPGKKERDSIWQLVDPFTLFHFRFLADPAGRHRGNWLSGTESPARSAWSGIAFEQLCLLHVPQIKKALGIAGVATSVFACRIPPGEDGEAGAQIDLVLDRADGIVNLCEMKYSRKPFAVTEKYRETLHDKVDAWKRAFGWKGAVHVTLVTASGLRRNAASDALQSVVNLDDLFEGGER